MTFKNFIKKLGITHGRSIKAAIYLEKGLLEIKKRNFEQAIKLLEKSKKHYNKLNNTEKMGECMAEIAISHFYLSPDQILHSEHLLDEAKAIFDRNTVKSDSLAKIKLYYGILEYNKKNHSEALKLYKNAQNLVNTNSIVHGCILDNLAIHHLRMKNFHLAQRYMEDALRIKVKNKNNSEIAYTATLLGRYFSSIEDINNAVKFLTLAEKLQRKDNNYTSLVRVLDEISKVYVLKKDVKNAESYHQKALDTAEKVTNKKIYAFLNCTLSEILTLKNQSEKALELLKNSVEPVFKTPREKAILKKAMSKVYTKLGHFELALEKNHEALSLFHSIENHIDTIKCHIDLAYIYAQKDYSQMATSSLLEAMELTKAHDLQIFTQKIEDVIFEFDKEEWMNIINKKNTKEKSITDNKSLIDTLNLLEGLTQEAVPYRDPLISLLKIGRSISAETNFDRLVQIIQEETKAALDANECTLFMYDKSANELWSNMIVGAETHEVRFSAKAGLAGYVARTGEGVNIKDAYNDERFNPEIDKQRPEKTKTILCIPFKNINQEIVGVFQVINKKDGRSFSDKDEDLLMAIGSSAGIALENARLFHNQNIMFEEQKNSFTSFVNALSASIDARDSITAGHSGRVKDLAEAICIELSLDEDDIEVIKYAANLHDIGKIGIRDDVLLKDGKLTDEEYKHIQQHAKITADILDKIYFQEKFKDVPLIASSHHEKYDGSGYFRKLKGNEIPLGGRVLAAADVFDAITSKRHYRDKMPIQKALQIMLDGSGSHFDPCIIDKFFEVPVSTVLNVIISSLNKELEYSQEEYFAKYTLGDLYEFLGKEEDSRNVIENLLITNFNKVYFQ